MKEKHYMLKFVLTTYGTSLLTFGVGLNELINYIKDRPMRPSSFCAAFAFSIVFLFLYIVTFRDEVELGKMMKSFWNFIIGFIPTLSAFIFNLLNFIFLINKYN